MQRSVTKEKPTIDSTMSETPAAASWVNPVKARLARGEYAAAMPQLSKYLEAKEQSPEQLDALFAFADCRRRFGGEHQRGRPSCKGADSNENRDGKGGGGH